MQNWSPSNTEQFLRQNGFGARKNVRSHDVDGDCTTVPNLPTPEDLNDENRLQILKNFSIDKLSDENSDSNFRGVPLESPRPHGAVLQDAKLVFKHNSGGPLSYIPGLGRYQYAYQEAYMVSPIEMLALMFPEFLSLLGIQATLAFNPLITIS